MRPTGQCLFDWNHRGFGPLSIVDAYAKSSDTFFYQMAVGLGVDRLGTWADELGFGERSGVRLPRRGRRNGDQQGVGAGAGSSGRLHR